MPDELGKLFNVPSEAELLSSLCRPVTRDKIDLFVLMVFAGDFVDTFSRLMALPILGVGLGGRGFRVEAEDIDDCAMRTSALDCSRLEVGLCGRSLAGAAECSSWLR